MENKKNIEIRTMHCCDYKVRVGSWICPEHGCTKFRCYCPERK